MNRLGAESSPYLLQHKDNPVHWYPWGAEAFARARAEDRPILLSVGYSACHWCHVMAHESFEDAETAAVMNALFVNVKVDREERPDVDHIYQTAVQLLRQSGGWPLTCFLTPDGRPFFAGTYFPDEARYGMPPFREVLRRIHAVWTERRGEVDAQASTLADALRRVHAREPGDGVPPVELLGAGAEHLLARIDPERGGFSGAPKFPSPTNLWTLWRHGARVEPAARDAVLLTLSHMAAGGIHDHLGGGFHRYSTDADWLVPHFEKMLYDNAQLASLYLEAWRACAHGPGPADAAPGFLRVASDTLDYLLREMCGPDGLFHAATDADSEGEEGRFFVWTPDEVAAVLGDGELTREFCRAYDVTPAGNWEGRSILRHRVPLATLAQAAGTTEAELLTRLAPARLALREARARRVPPLRDDKHLVAWNAFTISALVDGWRATGRADWLAAAERAATTILDTLVVDGRLLHSVCNGDRRGPAFLDDTAAFGLALLHLHEATGSARLRDAAIALAVALDGWFADPEAGGWFMTPSDGEVLLHRPKDTHDSAVPSGTGLAATFLLRLHAHTHEARWSDAVAGALKAHAGQLAENPFGAGQLLGVLDTWHHGFEEVVVGGGDVDTLLTAAGRAPGVDRIVLRLEALPPGHPAATGRAPTQPTAWVCRGFTCSLPITDPAELGRRLGASRAG